MKLVFKIFWFDLGKGNKILIYSQAPDLFLFPLKPLHYFSLPQLTSLLHGVRTPPVPLDDGPRLGADAVDHVGQRDLGFTPNRPPWFHARATRAPN